MGEISFLGDAVAASAAILVGTPKVSGGGAPRSPAKAGGAFGADDDNRGI